MGSWDMYGSDADKQRYNGLQSEFFSRATQPLSRRSSLLAFTSGGMCASLYASCWGCSMHGHMHLLPQYNTWPHPAQLAPFPFCCGVQSVPRPWSCPSSRARKYVCVRVIVQGYDSMYLHSSANRTAVRRVPAAKSNCFDLCIRVVVTRRRAHRNVVNRGGELVLCQP